MLALASSVLRFYQGGQKAHELKQLELLQCCCRNLKTSSVIQNGTSPCLHSFLGKQDQISSSTGRDLQSLKIACKCSRLSVSHRFITPSLEVHESASQGQRETIHSFILMTNPYPTAFARQESKGVKGRRGLCRERRKKARHAERTGLNPHP